jgi:hypothetical protein
MRQPQNSRPSGKAGKTVLIVSIFFPFLLKIMLPVKRPPQPGGLAFSSLG